VRVLVVWEPVLTTDWGAPSPALTSMIPDRRATHFYDRERRLSASMGGPGVLGTRAQSAKIGFQMEDVIWDAALEYPPGARWGDRAAALVAPVVKYREELAKALTR
jgi:hypothetical protein